MLERVLVVDDEPPARRQLVRLLRELTGVRDVHEAGCVDDAVALLAVHADFDVVFLDVQMPRASGFELFERCEVRTPIVFVTAFDRYAVRAFEVNALDYLLKPIEPARLTAAIARLGRGAPAAGASAALATDDVVAVRDRGRQRFVRVDDIAAIRAADDYTEVHLVNGSSLLGAQTMSEWETRLPAARFARIHRSTIIHLGRVVEIEARAVGAFVKLLGSDEPLRVARAYVAELKARLRDPA